MTKISYDLTNCETDNPIENIDNRATLNVTLRPTTGHVFDTRTPPVFSYQLPTGDYRETPFTTITEKEARGTLTNRNFTSITIIGTANISQPIATTYGTINVYKVTEDNLKAFAQQRFQNVQTDGGSATVTTIDIGRYVHSIKRIFATIEDGQTDVIRCGNINTQIACVTPQTDTITLDFGAITIPAPNGHIGDQKNTLELFIPFYGFAQLDSELTGQTITLAIDINVITGNGVAKLALENTPIAFYDLSPSQDVIYAYDDDDASTLGGTNWSERVLYGLEPFLRMKYYTSSIPTVQTDARETTVKTLTGYVKGDITLHTGNYTLAEREAIEEAFYAGIWVSQPVDPE